MINKLKIAIVNEDFDELYALADELDEKIKNHWLESLSHSELTELKALYEQVFLVLKKLKKIDLERLQKFKKSLNYIKN